MPIQGMSSTHTVPLGLILKSINRISLWAYNGASRFTYFVSIEGSRQFRLPLTGGIHQVFLGRLSASDLHFLSGFTPVTRPGQGVIWIRFTHIINLFIAESSTGLKIF